MTHDELLERVSEYISSECDCESCNFINGPYKALRAVVQLHRPISFPSTSGLPLECTVCRAEPYYSTNETYPCPTIQAIEKELV